MKPRKTQLSGAGRPLISQFRGKWPETPTLGQRIFAIPQLRNFEENKFAARRLRKPTRPRKRAAEWGGEAPNLAEFWEIAKDSYLDSTRFRSSAISEFREK